MAAPLDIVVLQSGLPELTTRLLESVYATFPEGRVILVDNGSCDSDLAETTDVLRGSDLLIRNGSNLGYTEGCNIGLEASTADVVCLQNNDTVMGSPGYARMLDHLAADSRLGLIGPMTDKAHSAQRGETRDHSVVSFEGGLISFFCVLITRETIERVGLLDSAFDMGYGVDVDYCHKVRAAGLMTGIAHDVWVHHDHGATTRNLIGVEAMNELGVRADELVASRYQ